MSPAEQRIAELEERRAERKARLKSEEAEQRAKDLEALDSLEVEHGDSNIAELPVPFSPGLPTCAVVRVPSDAEMKRFRFRMQPKKNAPEPDAVAAAIELASVCLVYPDKDTYERLLAARPGINVQLGLLAAKLAAGRLDEEGKG